MEEPWENVSLSV